MQFADESIGPVWTCDRIFVVCAYIPLVWLLFRRFVHKQSSSPALLTGWVQMFVSRETGYGSRPSVYSMLACLATREGDV